MVQIENYQLNLKKAEWREKKKRKNRKHRRQQKRGQKSTNNVFKLISEDIIHAEKNDYAFAFVFHSELLLLFAVLNTSHSILPDFLLFTIGMNCCYTQQLRRKVHSNCVEDKKIKSIVLALREKLFSFFVRFLSSLHIYDIQKTELICVNFSHCSHTNDIPRETCCATSENSMFSFPYLLHYLCFVCMFEVFRFLFSAIRWFSKQNFHSWTWLFAIRFSLYVNGEWCNESNTFVYFNLDINLWAYRLVWNVWISFFKLNGEQWTWKAEGSAFNMLNINIWPFNVFKHLKNVRHFARNRVLIVFKLRT